MVVAFFTSVVFHLPRFISSFLYGIPNMRFHFSLELLPPAVSFLSSSSSSSSSFLYSMSNTLFRFLSTYALTSSFLPLSTCAPLPLQLLRLFTHSMSFVKRVKVDGNDISKRSYTDLCSYLEMLLTDLLAIYATISDTDGLLEEVQQARKKIVKLSHLVLSLWKTCMHGIQDASTAAVSLFNPGDPVRHFKHLRVSYGTIVAARFSGSKWEYTVKWIGIEDAERHVYSDHMSPDDFHLGWSLSLPTLTLYNCIRCSPHALLGTALLLTCSNITFACRVKDNR